MDSLNSIIFGILIILLVIFTIILFKNEKFSKIHTNITKNIVRIGIFGAISAVLYIFVKFPVPFFPSFLEFHFDEIPAFIAGFAYGPIVGTCVILVRTLIKLPFSSTLFVGEFADLIYSLVLILPASIIYRYKKNFKSALTGMVIGGFAEVVVALFLNIFVMIPFYSNVMGIPLDAIIAMISKANPLITDASWMFGLLAVVPFNLIKNVVVILLTLLIYKRTHKLINNVTE